MRLKIKEVDRSKNNESIKCDGEASMIVRQRERLEEIKSV
jgi:hypothetical protein